MPQPHKLPYNKEIAKKVRECSAAGLTLRDTIAEIQNYGHAPRHNDSFYRLYSEDWFGPRNDITRKIGNRVANQAIEGDPEQPTTFKSQELWLRTQGGWTPKESVETREAGTDEEEAESAVEALMTLLGKGTDEDSGDKAPSEAD